MATRTLSALASNATDAGFQAWVTEIHAALTAFGWVQATGVGTQINPATVTRPTAINTYQGYSVWKMNDSLQATAAVFLRLDFGTGQATNVPGMKVQVAIGGCDSSGNLTGIIGTSHVLNNNSTIQGSNTNIRTSGSTSSFRLLWRIGSTANRPMCIIIGRDRDTSGNETALGVNVAVCFHNGAYSQFIESPSGNLGAVDTLWYAMVSAQSSQAGSSNVGVGAVRCQLGPFRNPMIGALVCARSDYTHDTTNLVTIYGASHTYLMQTEATGMALNTWNGNCGIAMLWE